MAFPSSPSVGQIYTNGVGFSYIYTANGGWARYNAPSAVLNDVRAISRTANNTDAPTSAEYPSPTNGSQATIVRVDTGAITHWYFTTGWAMVPTASAVTAPGSIWAFGYCSTNGTPGIVSPTGDTAAWTMGPGFGNLRIQYGAGAAPTVPRFMAISQDPRYSIYAAAQDGVSAVLGGNTALWLGSNPDGSLSVSSGFATNVLFDYFAIVVN